MSTTATASGGTFRGKQCDDLNETSFFITNSTKNRQRVDQMLEQRNSVLFRKLEPENWMPAPHFNRFMFNVLWLHQRTLCKPFKSEESNIPSGQDCRHLHSFSLQPVVMCAQRGLSGISKVVPEQSPTYVTFSINGPFTNVQVTNMCTNVSSYNHRSWLVLIKRCETTGQPHPPHPVLASLGCFFISSLVTNFLFIMRCPTRCFLSTSHRFYRLLFPPSQTF